MCDGHICHTASPRDTPILLAPCRLSTLRCPRFAAHIIFQYAYVPRPISRWQQHEWLRHVSCPHFAIHIPFLMPYVPHLCPAGGHCKEPATRFQDPTDTPHHRHVCEAMRSDPTRSDAGGTTDERVGTGQGRLAFALRSQAAAGEPPSWLSWLAGRLAGWHRETLSCAFDSPACCDIRARQAIESNPEGCIATARHWRGTGRPLPCAIGCY